MDRCIAYNKNNKKCRAKLTDNNLFCCESHKPLNYELIIDGCFICSEKVTNINDLYYFKCKHIMHKQCYNEWLEYSSYSTPICMLCRGEVFKEQKKKINIRKNGVINKNDYNKLKKIINILGI
jgi:hypothetical protein